MQPRGKRAESAELWGDLVKQYAPPGLFVLLLVGGLACAGISCMITSTPWSPRER